MARTPHRTVRVPDDLWDAAHAKAAVEETTVSTVIVDALKEFLRRPPRRREPWERPAGTAGRT